MNMDTSQRITIDIKESFTLPDVVEKIHEVIPTVIPDEVVLVYKSKKIEPHFTMKAFYLKPNAIIHMVKQLNIQQNNKQQSI